MKVRLYGPTIGQGSFVRVASGMREGLEAHGKFAGFVPIDALEDDAAYPGHDADVGVYVGPPPGATIMQQRGWHQHRLCLFSPNSTWISKSIVEALTKESPTSKSYCTGFITPSVWAKSQIEKNCNVPVVLWHHGVAECFKPDEQFAERRRKAFVNGFFEAVHFASTPMQRKGTRELIRAWLRLVDQKKLGIAPQLNLLVDGGQHLFEDAIHVASSAALESIQWRGRMSLPVEAAAALYRRSHACIQPSRGEAFGMCTLESRCCGTPVVATTCTGHDDQFMVSAVGFIPITTGDLEPIDDGPQALAPSLKVEDIEEQIEHLFCNWHTYEFALNKLCGELRDHWSWSSVTGRWLEQMRKMK